MSKRDDRSREMRVYDARSRRAMPLPEYAERLQREASMRRFWVRIGLALTLTALLVTIAVRIWRG